MTTDPRSVVFEGTFEQVQEHFHERQWSDGLPIVPPTLDAVSRFLSFTKRAPDAVLGVLPPANQEASVWTVAVNGVMAGCRPEYMPLLIAAVEAISDPEFRLQDAGSTPGWEPLIIVSGPIIGELDFNVDGGVMRVGRRANSTIGRFLRLFMRNVAGLRIPPGELDKATIGMNFMVALPENEPVVRELGWPTFGQDRGFEPNASVVTVQSIISASVPTYTAGSTGLEHVSMLSEVIGQGMWAYWSFTALLAGKYFPLLLLSPSIARAIAGDGWSKDDIRAYFGANVKLPAESFERYAFAAGQTHFSFKRLVSEGLLPGLYVESDDPKRLLPVFPKPETIGIVVAGDATRNNSRGYVQNQDQGPPVSRAIDR